MELKNYIPKFLTKKREPKLSEKELQLSHQVSKIIGHKVNSIKYYREAFTLKNDPKNHTKNYERLEFLGDAVLGSMVSSHLFDTYPKANEGFLTQMKSKIVNRKNLNDLGEKLMLTQLIQDEKNGFLSENINGNLFEALIGAIYLDYDYDICKHIVMSKLLNKEEMLKLENKIISYKGLLLEWSQKRKKEICYETCEEVLPNKATVFKSTITVSGNIVAHASETSKKKAEEKAAQRAFYSLNKKEHILEKQKNIS